MNPEQQQPTIRRTSARSPAALRILVAGLVFAVLYFAQAAFIPVALSLLFALLLSSPVDALHRRGLPRFVSALLILIVFIGGATAAINYAWEPAQQWIKAAPHTARTIEQKIGPAAQFLHRIEAISERVGHLTDGDASNAAKSTPAPPAPGASRGLLFETRVLLIASITVIILTLFLLAGGTLVLARMGAAFVSDLHAARVAQIIHAVRHEVGRYYGIVALINLGLGVATGLAMTALGMPNPFLWGVLAAVLNFIPYVGSTVTLVVLTVVAFVSFDGVGRVVAVAAAYLGLATVEGQIVQPLLVGQRLELNPIVVFLALWFAGWFWGIAGIVMAVPSLVALKVVAEHSKGGAPVIEFLSPLRPKRLNPRGMLNPAAGSGAHKTPVL